MVNVHMTAQHSLVFAHRSFEEISVKVIYRFLIVQESEVTAKNDTAINLVLCHKYRQRILEHIQIAYKNSRYVIFCHILSEQEFFDNLKLTSSCKLIYANVYCSGEQNLSPREKIRGSVFKKSSVSNSLKLKKNKTYARFGELEIQKKNASHFDKNIAQVLYKEDYLLIILKFCFLQLVPNLHRREKVYRN